jgi:hypothetical protein
MTTALARGLPRRCTAGQAGPTASRIWPFPEYLAAKLGFTEAGRFEAWGAEQWFGMWSPVTPSG